MTETAKVYFESVKYAIPVAKNLGTPLNDTLSIEGDKEKIQVALKEENIPAKAYSLATVEDAK